MANQPFSRLTVPDPQTNRALNDVYDKLAQLQSVLPSQIIKAGTLPLAKITTNGTAGSITIGPLGFVTAYSPPT